MLLYAFAVFLLFLQAVFSHTVPRLVISLPTRCDHVCLVLKHHSNLQDNEFEQDVQTALVHTDKV